MKAEPQHRCRVIATPWAGVHGTITDSARHYGRHAHDSFGLGLIEQGAQRSASGRGTVEAWPGNLITTNPGEVHDGRPLAGGSRRWRIVYLDPEALSSIAGIGTGVELTRPVFEDAPLRAALMSLFACLEAWQGSRDAADALACDEALARCTQLLLRGHASARPASEVAAGVQRARQRLADALLSPPSLAELAALEGLSRYQLLRRFEQACGLPPHAWLMQQRLERARRLISQGLGLAEAAAAAGYADQSHMTRQFVQRLGFTPGAWRAAALQ
jgi:AraC-like DNA-binding protein